MQTSFAQDTATVKPTAGIDHIGLAVSDLNASTNFFVEALGFKVAGRDPKYPASFMSNGEMNLTLWQTSDDTVEFNRKKNVGLHHLAIRVPSFEALDSLYQTVKAMRVLRASSSFRIVFGRVRRGFAAGSLISGFE